MGLNGDEYVFIYYVQTHTIQCNQTQCALRIFLKRKKKAFCSCSHSLFIFFFWPEPYHMLQISCASDEIGRRKNCPASAIIVHVIGYIPSRTKVYFLRVLLVSNIKLQFSLKACGRKKRYNTIRTLLRKKGFNALCLDLCFGGNAC